MKVKGKQWKNDRNSRMHRSHIDFWASGGMAETNPVMPIYAIPRSHFS